MPRDFVKDVIDAFSKIKEEIDEKRGELDFRHSLANYLLKNVLDWGRKKGEGHLEIREREDIRLFDDQNRCVAIIETKNPKIARLLDSHISELKEHLDDYTGIAQYGALTNGHEFRLFEYTSKGELNELVSINVDTFVQKGTEALSRAERERIHLLRRLRKDHFVGIVEPEYFKKTVGEIKVEDPKNFEIFIEDLRASLNELTEIMGRFFRFYRKVGSDHYGGKFLRDEAFPMWKGASIGKEEELIEKFCRETAYVFLNRILFTRILEDKGIVQRMVSGKEFAQSLLMFGESAYEMVLGQAYKNVEKFYEHFYEFGIFDWWRLPQEKRGMLSGEDTKVQNELEKDLNAVVIRDVLKLLNRFDFRNVSRDLLGDVYQEYLPPAERKRLGEFYTPVEVVRYILDAVGYVPENRIEDKLLLDPACGSGTFLVEAAKRLVKRYEEKLKNPLLPDNAKVIIERVASNIHGLDINPFACHIAEMNLLFNIIDYLNAVHNKYRDYRLPRFNVCNTDSLVPAEVEAAQITEYITNGRIRAHMEEARRAKQVKEKHFDLIVGNPPYVNVKIIPEEAKKYYKKTYRTAYEMFDLYILFIEKGINWLKNGGKLGFIVPSKFLATKYGKKLRNFILDNCVIKQAVDVSYVKVFGETTPYPIIIILERGGDEKQRMSNKIKGISVWKDDPKILAEVNKFLDEKSISTADFEIYPLSQKRFHENPDNMFDINLSDDLYSMTEKIERESISLGDICAVLVGIQTKKEVTGASKEDIVVKPEDYKKLDLRTKAMCQKKLDGNGIEKFRIRWDGEYLIYDRPRLYHSPPESVFKKPKILIKDISKQPRATYDDEGYYCFDTVYIISPKKKEFGLKYVLAIINSKLMHFYYIKRFSPAHVGGGYLRFRRPFLIRFPIKIASKDKQQKVEILTDGILQMNKQFNVFEEKHEKFPESYLSEEKLEKLVNVAEKCELPKEKYNTNSLAIEPVKKAGKELYKLALTKEDYILFSSRAVAECALEQLKRKNKVRIDEIHNLKVPSEKDAVRVIEEFFNDKKRVDEIKKEVEKLEQEIDELVYKLYGLDAKDREVIEEFLKKF